jgi:LexA-binding, inner membrane-associated putative hydrolase
MPSPIGHALGGLAAGWLVAGAPRGWPADVAAWRRDVLLFALLGTAPDLDLLVGAHSGPTHGLGAAGIVGLVAFAASGSAGSLAGRLRFAFACALAYASHTLLDWLGNDSSPPLGIMALWPLTREHYESSLHVFMAISRRYWIPELFWWNNFLALARELVILVPLVALVWLLRRKAPGA